MKKLVIASSNQGKITEIKAILKDMEIEILSMKDVFNKNIEIEENGTTFKENALIKAQAISSAINLPVLADDSGLEVDALDKQPGVYSARFLGEDTSYDVKNQYILDKLKDVPEAQRTARFVCVVAAVFPDGETFTRRGTIEGIIGYEIAGENGFGYDPIFYVPEYHCTTAELSTEVKNTISHRGKALRAIREVIEEKL